MAAAVPGLPLSGAGAERRYSLSTLSALESSRLPHSSLFSSLSMLCPVCKNHYDDVTSSRSPFLLSCAHTLCTVCAHSVIAQCPVCHQTATLFKENLAMKALVSDLKRLLQEGEVTHNADRIRPPVMPSFHAPRANRVGCYGKYAGEFYSTSLETIAEAGLCVNSTTQMVYLCDTVHNRVVSLKEDENEHKHCATMEKFDGKRLEEPRDAAYDPAADTLFVADSGNHRVIAIKCDDSGGMTGVFAFGREGSKAGQLKFPYGIATDPSAGLVYVSDRGNRRVTVWSSKDGTFLSQFGGGDVMTSPMGVAVDPVHGIVYVVDGSEAQVQVWQRKPTTAEASHMLVHQFGHQGSGQGSGQFVAPTYAAFDSHVQILYVSDCRRKDKGDIQAFKSFSTDAKCRVLRSWSLRAHTQPFGIACDPHSGFIFAAAAKPKGHIQIFM